MKKVSKDVNAEPTTTTRIIRCPGCQRSTPYDPSNEYRPFCSARCKNNDIIAWAQERYQVPGAPLVDLEELEPAVQTPPLAGEPGDE